MVALIMLPVDSLIKPCKRYGIMAGGLKISLLHCFL